MQSHTQLIRFQVRNRIRFTSSGLLKSSRTKRIAERSPLSDALCAKPGGANRDRTGDLLLAKQALSQLSYGPGELGWWVWLELNQRPPPYQDGALTN